LPDGSKVHRAAGNYIAGLPKREHDMFAWRVAIEALMLVAEHGGDIMSPRIGIIRVSPSASATGTFVLVQFVEASDQLAQPLGEGWLFPRQKDA
jgi:hypothetical protein